MCRELISILGGCLSLWIWFRPCVEKMLQIKEWVVQIVIIIISCWLACYLYHRLLALSMSSHLNCKLSTHYLNRRLGFCRPSIYKSNLTWYSTHLAALRTRKILTSLLGVNRVCFIFCWYKTSVVEVHQAYLQLSFVNEQFILGDTVLLPV